MGVTAEMATGGLSVIVAVVSLVESAALVAVIVTVVAVVTVAGAVYLPVWSMDPAVVGLIDQFTVVLVALVTVAANCCV